MEGRSRVGGDRERRAGGAQLAQRRAQRGEDLRRLEHRRILCEIGSGRGQDERLFGRLEEREVGRRLDERRRREVRTATFVNADRRRQREIALGGDRPEDVAAVSRDGRVHVVQRVRAGREHRADVLGPGTGTHHANAVTARRRDDRVEHTGREARRLVYREPLEAGVGNALHLRVGLFDVGDSPELRLIGRCGTAEPGPADLQAGHRMTGVVAAGLETRRLLERSQVQPSGGDARSQQLAAGDRARLTGGRATRRQAARHHEVDVRVDEPGKQAVIAPLEDLRAGRGDAPGGADGRDAAVPDQHVAPRQQAVGRPDIHVADEQRRGTARLNRRLCRRGVRYPHDERRDQRGHPVSHREANCSARQSRLSTSRSIF